VDKNKCDGQECAAVFIILSFEIKSQKIRNHTMEEAVESSAADEEDP
jgi:hypothetical protein